MKSQDGYAPSAEDTTKLNEIVTWLVDNGFHGMMLIHKGDVGTSWVRVKDADEVRVVLINSLGHIMAESEDAAIALVQGMAMAVEEIMGE